MLEYISDANAFIRKYRLLPYICCCRALAAKSRMSDNKNFSMRILDAFWKRRDDNVIILDAHSRPRGNAHAHVKSRPDKVSHSYERNGAPEHHILCTTLHSAEMDYQ